MYEVAGKGRRVEGVSDVLVAVPSDVAAQKPAGKKNLGGCHGYGGNCLICGRRRGLVS